MWDSRRSILLSKVCVAFFLAALAALAVFAPRAVSFVLAVSRAELGGKAGLFLATIYPGCALAALLLVQLYGVLHRIAQGAVFVRKNITALRLISWLCILGGVVAAVSALYYRPWLLIAAAAGFMGLIVRVVKNVFARAAELQDEADFTI